MKNEIEICKYFFENYCIPTKTKRTNFGKVTIELSMSTYVSGQSFYQALKELNIPMSGTSYHNCKFALKIKREYKDRVLFAPFALAESRLESINSLNK